MAELGDRLIGDADGIEMHNSFAARPIDVITTKITTPEGMV